MTKASKKGSTKLLPAKKRSPNKVPSKKTAPRKHYGNSAPRKKIQTAKKASTNIPQSETRVRTAGGGQGLSSSAAYPTGTSYSAEKLDRLQIRMYCLGTGDCFTLKFFQGNTPAFTMLIDCGSCRGTKEDFLPYIKDLLTDIGEVDLLVVTHEHTDHTNGFDKCEDLFKGLPIKEAWMAWTENPADPEGAAQELLAKRAHLRYGFSNALKKVEENKASIEKELSLDYYNQMALAATTAFLDGLQTLGEINLSAAGGGQPLPGMQKLKDKLTIDKIPVKYLYPGETRAFKQLPGIKFHILGPPLDKKYVYKEGKEGRDIYKRHFSMGESMLAAAAFSTMNNPVPDRDLPFGREYVLDTEGLTPKKIADVEQEEIRLYLTACSKLVDKYSLRKWRQIENEWLYSAGALAIRLNSHINNTSLAIAIEFGNDGKVVLLPGDAEYGSWESWHMIEKWAGEGKNGKHFTEDLLNRTVFYKVGHHLSFNGTPIEKGIRMMKHPDLTAMATLDRTRISSRWKSTMPNKELLKELVAKTKGKCFIMEESEIDNAPSKTLDPTTLGDSVYEEKWKGDKLIYKQFTLRV